MSVPKDGGLSPKAGAKPKTKDDGRVLVAASKSSAAKTASKTKK